MGISFGSPQEALAHYCRTVYEKRLSPGTAGNMSIRDGETVYITPSGCCLGEVSVDDLVELSLEGEKADPHQKPSSEWFIHQALYKIRPDIHAIIHAHPTKASALTASYQMIQPNLIAEVIYHLGDIPMVPYILPGTQALAEAVAAHAAKADVLLLSNHGVITLGSTVRQAFFHLELLESYAEIFMLANMLPGGAKTLTDKQVEEIRNLKTKQASASLSYL